MATLIVPDSYATITAAFAAAVAGDVIQVKNGTYNEEIDSSITDLTIEAFAGHSPVMIGSGGKTLALRKSSSTGIWNITGIEFKLYASAAASSGAVQGASSNGSHVNIRQCHIWGCNRGIVNIKGTSITDPAIISQNLIHDIQEYGMLLNNANHDFVSIRNNIIYNTGRDGIIAQGDNGVSVVNNTLHNAGTSSAYMPIRAFIDNNNPNINFLEYKNNIISNTVSQGIAITASTAYRSNNYISGTFTTYFPGGNQIGEISSSTSLFSGLANKDFSINYCGPLANTGSYSLNIVNLTDYSGSSRGSTVFSSASVVFDGSNDAVTFPFTQISGSSAWSLSLWTRLHNNSATLIQPVMLQIGSNADLVLRMSMWESNTVRPNAVGVEAKFSTTSGSWYSESNVIKKGQWHHIAITYDGSNTTNKPIIYIDNSSSVVSTLSIPTGSFDNSTVYLSGVIGNNDQFAGAGQKSWRGDLHNISLWNKVLSSAEVASLYSTQVPSNLSQHSAAQNLISWYRLDGIGFVDTKDYYGANSGSVGGGTSSPSSSVAYKKINLDIGALEAAIIAAGAAFSTGSYGTRPKYTPDFTLSANYNITGEYQLIINGQDSCTGLGGDSIDQVPFSLGIKGVANLRGRSKAYAVSTGDRPDRNN